MTNAPTPSPLDEAQLAVLGQTRAAQRKLRFAGFIALSNVIGLATFAFLSLVVDLFSLSLSLITIPLGVLAWNEARGRTLLLAGDASAPRRLAYNQLALLACVIVYCIHSAYAAWTGPSLLDTVLLADPSIPDMLGDAANGAGTSLDELSHLGRVTALVVYGAVALGSAAVQGLTALYYRSLQPAVAALAAAPAWARELA
ncbi:MAG TPA: hypothetical protein VMG12_43720 [Polyangiaceae bacterium]|nr:hypothetical protein [Polyangiaceae bacterium]